MISRSNYIHLIIVDVTAAHLRLKQRSVSRYSITFAGLASSVSTEESNDISQMFQCQRLENVKKVLESMTPESIALVKASRGYLCYSPIVCTSLFLTCL